MVGNSNRDSEFPARNSPTDALQTEYCCSVQRVGGQPRPYGFDEQI